MLRTGAAAMIVAQITDLHLGGPIAVAGSAVDPRASLDRAVAHLNQRRPAPDLVLVTGDLTQEGGPEEYADARAGLAALDMPAYVIPGNHDDRANMAAAFGADGYLPKDGGFLHYVIDGRPLRILALDTHVPGESGGALCDERLAWLERRLAEEPERPTLIAMHHPPFATGIPAFDAIGCRGGDALGDLVVRYHNIEGVLCGHVHRAMDMRWRGTVVSVTPSTVYQYPLELGEGAKFVPVPEPAACRLCLWTPGVGLVSHLSYIAPGGVTAGAPDQVRR